MCIRDRQFTTSLEGGSSDSESGTVWCNFSTNKIICMLQQQKLRDSAYALYWRQAELSWAIFCLWVCQASVSPDQISTFSNIYRHTSPMLTLYHVIPSSASFYWPSTTKYQTVSPYTDPVPAGTTYNSSFRKAQLINFSFYDSFDESRTVYLV